MEEWKPIADGTYEVSSLGRVKRARPGRGATAGKILKQNPMPESGYLQVGIYDNGIKITRFVHRLVAEAFVKNPHGFTDVKHIDGDVTNNRAENLRWRKHGQGANPGENHPLAKLSENDAACIIHLIASGMKHKQIAALYHVSVGTVAKIASGERWKHIQR